MSTHLNVQPRDLSFIVQGPVYNAINNSKRLSVTCRALNSIRENFPEAELILSTWEGGNVDNLTYDVLVLNKDPGSEIMHPSGVRHNVNRQIVSTMAGLKVASRKYIIKTRTDVVFTHNKCLDYLFCYQKRSDDYRFTKERVLVASVTSVNPNKYLQFPYHPCDWFYFGLKEDMIDIFDIPFFPEPEFTHWFKTRECPINHPAYWTTARYAPESYLWYSFCKKHLDIKFDHLCDISNNNIEISERIFANNLVVLKPSQLGIVSLKNKYVYSYLYHMYTFTEWKRLYNKYCQGTLPIGYDFDMALYRLAHYVNMLRPKIGLRTIIKKVSGIINKLSGIIVS